MTHTDTQPATRAHTPSSPLQGPTISNVYNMNSDGTAADLGFYAATICVSKKKLYAAVKALQKLGGSGVLVQPMTYIFDEEPERWRDLLARLGLDEKDPRISMVAQPAAVPRPGSA